MDVKKKAKKREVNPLWLESGRRVKSLLKQRNMTQVELAQILHYSVQHVSYILCGRERLIFELAKKIADLLNVDYRYLLCEIDFPTVEEKVHALNETEKACAEIADSLLSACGLVTADAQGYEQLRKVSLDGAPFLYCTSLDLASLKKEVVEYARFAADRFIRKQEGINMRFVNHPSEEVLIVPADDYLEMMSSLYHAVENRKDTDMFLPEK